MSEPSRSPAENTGSPKKKVSPARNLIGLIVLVVVLAVAGFQYAALIRYSFAVKALDARALDDDKGLMTNQEADSLLDKAPDGPGSDFTEEGRRFTKKTYTWQGPLKSFTLTAFYTNGSAAFLHHFEAQGEKYVPKWSHVITTGPIRVSKGKGRSKKKKNASTATGDAKTATVPGKVTAPAAGGEPSKATAAPAPAPATAAGPAGGPPKPTTTPAPAPAKPGAPPAEPSKGAPAASEPKAILEKGISALGGAEKLGMVNAFTWKAKGTITYNDNENDFTAAVTIKGLDQFKREFRNDHYTGVVVLDGAKGWRNFGEYFAELEGELLASEKRYVYYQVVPITLVALKGNGFKYEANGEEKVRDKAAVILKVTGPDGKDFTLSLDKETGLPLKLVGKRVGYKGGEYIAEITFADYKDFDGIKKATKVETKRDGEQFEKWQITEFKVLDKVEPDTFAQPN